MSNCLVDMSHPMQGYDAQDKDNQIIVSVTEEIRPCVRWKANKYTSVDKGTASTYSRKDVPDDMLNCSPIKCLNTGTQYVTVSSTGDTQLTYQVRANAENFALGFLFFYLNLPKAGEYELAVKVSDVSEASMTNAYTYVQSFKTAVPGFVLRTLDFADPTSIRLQNGTGWQPSTRGVKIAIMVKWKAQDSDALTTETVGYSSPFIVGDRSELRKFTNVLLSCLTSFTHNVSVPATDARCFGRQYDPTQVEITKEITATTTSVNDYWLNPLQSMSKVLTSGIPVTDQFEVDTFEFEGKTYGRIVLPDLFYGDCNSITISSDVCAITQLSMIPVTSGINLEEDEFMVLTAESSGVDRGTILVSQEYVGENLLVTYNAERDVELIVANEKRLDNVHFRVIEPVVNTRGVKEYHVFNNVLVTELSREYVTEGEIALQLSYTVSRDKNGNFYEIRRDVDDIA